MTGRRWLTSPWAVGVGVAAVLWLLSPLGACASATLGVASAVGLWAWRLRAARGVDVCGTPVGRALAWGVVYPVRVWWGLFVALLVVGCGFVWSAVLATCAAVGLRVYARVILATKSIRYLPELNALVKSYRMQRRVRRNWRSAMHEANLTTTSLRGGRGALVGAALGAPGVHRVLAVPRRSQRVDVTPFGVATYVALSGVAGTADDIRAKLPNLESKFGAIGSRVTATDVPGTVRLDLRHTDPLRQRVSLGVFVGMSFHPPSVPVGIDEDGHPVVKSPTLPTMILGAQGSGKSTEVWTIIYGLLVAGVSFRLRIFDPKGQEFPDLADAAYTYCRSRYAWPDFLAEACGALSKRQRSLAARSIRNLMTATHGRFTDLDPLDVMVPDELLATRSSKLEKIKFEDIDRHQQTIKVGDAFTDYLSQGRAAGFSVIGLSQLGQKDVLGADIVDLFPNKTLLRCSTDDQVRMVLDADPNAYPAHRIPEGLPGVGYVDTRSPRDIVRYRSAEPTEADRLWIVGQVAAMKARQEAAQARRRAAQAAKKAPEGAA